jgi:hypothetical protein
VPECAEILARSRALGPSSVRAVLSGRQSKIFAEKQRVGRLKNESGACTESEIENQHRTREHIPQNLKTKTKIDPCRRFRRATCAGPGRLEVLTQEQGPNRGNEGNHEKTEIRTTVAQTQKRELKLRAAATKSRREKTD